MKHRVLQVSRHTGIAVFKNLRAAKVGPDFPSLRLLCAVTPRVTQSDPASVRHKDQDAVLRVKGNFCHDSESFLEFINRVVDVVKRGDFRCDKTRASVLQLARQEPGRRQRKESAGSSFEERD